MLQPIKRRDLFDDVVLCLRGAIFAGTFAPGERVVEDNWPVSSE